MIRIDARGMRCPWPAIRAARALRDCAAGVEVLADDPNAAGELRTVAEQTDTVLSVGSAGVYRLTRPSAV